ncbi:MAG: hypothetical protein WBA13_01215 [Microcoleaceae cyanobacterium]
MLRTELQQKTELSEIKLDTLLNKLSRQPQWNEKIDIMSDEVSDAVAQFIIDNHSPDKVKSLKGGKQPSQNTVESPSSIEPFEGDEMATTAEAGIDNQRASTDQYQSNSQGMQSGIIHEQIEQKQFEGQVAGEVSAAAFVSSYSESFQQTLTRYGNSQFNAHVDFMEDLFGMAKSVSAQSSESRVKALSDRSEEYQKMKQRVQGKFQ